MHKTFRIWFAVSVSHNRKSKTCLEPCRSIQNRKWAGLFAIVVALTVFGVRAEAQQPTKVPRIGFLGGVAVSGTARTEAFRQGLRELGYVEEKNIVIEWRYAEWEKPIASARSRRS